jgi:ABC-type glycerol-3-phosphate transport system permease component
MGQRVMRGSSGVASASVAKPRSRGVWRSKRFQEYFWRGVALTIVVLGAIAVLIPFMWMLSTALKSHMETFVFKWIPAKLMFANFPKALTAMPFGRFFRNTAFVTFSAMFGEVLTASAVAYGFARLRAPGREVLFLILLGTLMLPGQVTMIPMYLLYNKLGWVNSYKPLIIPSYFGGGAFSIFLLRQFFMTIPLEMDDAAKMDGCGFFQTYWRLILPLARPALATIAIFSFMGNWNDFMGPLIYINEWPKFTVALGLQFFAGSSVGSGSMELMMAASLTALLPCLILFFAAQRLFIQGIVITGVKG